MSRKRRRKKPVRGLDAFLRGSEIVSQKFRMVKRRIGKLVFYALVIGVVIGGMLLYVKADVEQRYLFYWYVKAALQTNIVNFFDDGNYVVLDKVSDPKRPGGWYWQARQGNYNAAVTYRYYQGVYGGPAHVVLGKAFLAGLTVGGCVVAAIAAFSYRVGVDTGEDQHVRGSKERIEAGELVQRLAKAKKIGAFSIAGVPLLPEGETYGILVTGAIGTGKSTAKKDVLDQVRAKGQRAMILDLSGEYIGPYYREGHDIILNPLDARCPPWSIWNEVAMAASYELFAESLIPRRPTSEPFWQQSARELLSSTAERLAKEGRATNAELYDVIVNQTLPEIAKLVKGTPAARVVDPSVEKMGLGVVAEASPRLKAWRYLPEPTAENPGFSIRKWIRDEDSDQWVFLSCPAEITALVKPLLTLWFDLAGKSILSLPEDLSRRRRIWLCLDEISSLDFLTSLPELLRLGRKNGQCPMLGLQTISDFYAIYGKETADGIFNNLHTRLILGAREPNTAEWLSRMLGRAEVEEPQEGYSMGADDRADRVNFSRRRTTRVTILDSEILNLKKLEGFLSLPDGWPVVKVRLQVRDRPYRAKHFVPREEGGL